MTHGLILHGEALACSCQSWLAMGEPEHIAAAYLAHRRYRAAAVPLPDHPHLAAAPATAGAGSGSGTAGSPSRAVPAVPPSEN